MGVVSMKQLLEAGVHFGHQTRRWNPKMARYIFTERNGIYIIDLQKTVKKLDEAYMFVRDLAANGGNVLFVGTKKQAGDSVREEATRAGAYYVNARWLGGMMTNFKTSRRRIQRLEQLRKMKEDGTFERLPKKEVIKLELEIEKLVVSDPGMKFATSRPWMMPEWKISLEGYLKFKAPIGKFRGTIKVYYKGVKKPTIAVIEGNVVK